MEKRSSTQFADVCNALLERGLKVHFRAQGKSMQPNILDGDAIVVVASAANDLKRGDVVLTRGEDGFRVHRVLRDGRATEEIVTRGDAGQQNDTATTAVLGKVVAIERNGESTSITKPGARFLQASLILIRRLRLASSRRFKRLGSSLALFGVLIAFGVLLNASPAAAQADLALTQAAAPSVVAPLGTITYTLNLTNNGPNTAVTPVVYQQTPPNTTFQSITSPANWTCNTPGVGLTGQIICTFTGPGGNFTNGSTAAFTIMVTVNNGVAPGTVILNSTDTTSTTADPVGSNDASTSFVLVETAGQADLAVAMTAAPTPVFVFSNLTYTIQVQNLGLVNTANGTLTDTIPAGTTFVSSSTTQGSCAGAATVTCTLGAIASASTITVTITVTAPSTPTTLTNTPAVTSATADPVAGNNNATVLTVVQPLACASPGRDGAGGVITGVVNAYYRPTASEAAGSTSVPLAAATGANSPIAVGDLLLFIQMQDAAINSTNTGAYGDGSPGDPGSGSTNLNSSGEFEFVTATSAIPNTGGTVNFLGTGPGGGLLNTYTTAAAAGAQGQRRYQVIRVPQYTSATLSSGLTALAWNGQTGGVLAIDVASQVTLAGTVSVDAEGFRGGAGVRLGGGVGAATDYVKLSTTAANGSKGEGIAGTPFFVVNATITNLTNTGVEGLPNGSYARGAPGNAGGGATDANPTQNNQNSGGGGGGNGGAGGQGGFGWNSAGIVGGFGGSAFPASSSALVMGGGAGAGTTNDGTADPANGNPAGINSSGASGGGIVIVHAGTATGTGTITANGQTALNVQNDGGGGGGAGGSIRFLTNSGGLGGLTARANGGNGGNTWGTQVPGAFPGNRHGPGGGGSGGVIEFSAAPAGTSVSAGLPGVSTTATDAYGATAGSPGVTNPGLTIVQTPGTQSGAVCASADLAVTDSGTPNPVLAAANITYTQTVTNNGPRDAVNAVFSEAVPANTTFQSLTVAAGWTCTTPAVNGTGNINCTNPDVANAAVGTFTLVVQVNAGTAVGTVITNTIDATSGTSDPNLGNNTATVQITVGSATSADLSITNTATPNPVLAGNNITYTVVVKNNSAVAAANVSFTDTESTPTHTTFVSVTPAAGWSCPAPGLPLTCSIAALAANASATFTVVVKVTAGTASGTVITYTADVSATTPDPNPNNNSAIVTVVVATAGQADMSVTSSDSPNPVTDGNNITYVQTATNNGPAVATGATFTDTLPANTTFVSFVQPAGWACVTPAVGATGTVTCTNAAVAVGATANFPLVVKVNMGTAPGTVISNTANVSATPTDPNSANNSVTSTTVVASPTQADVAILKTATPEPVNQGTNLTYTLQVTNNGPAVAQGVTVQDTLPMEVTFVSATTTQGSCTNVGSPVKVTCPLGTISVGGLAIVTINVTASTFSSSTLATNTATVSSTTSDPNLTNNSSTATSTIASPTAVQLASFRALTRAGGGILLEWRTREEIRNLGFNIYREDAQSRHRLNPSIIAGSALLIRGGRPQHAAKSYQWLDPDGTPQSTYSLEDVDLNGTRTSHGPVHADVASESSEPVSHPLLLTQLNRAMAQAVAPQKRPLSTPMPVIPELTRGEVRVSLEELPAVKISVHSEGWYRVSRAQLVAAGLDPGADARDLQLFAEGVEQPILIVGRQNGPLGLNDSIEFYGTGIDTPFSDARVYWLVRGSRPGKRIAPVPTPRAGLSEPQSFLFTVVREDRTTYFATLLNGENADNFFGAIITSVPADQELTTAHTDPNSSLPVTLDVRLQGGTDAQDHRVSVAFNGAFVGEIDFVNQANVTNTFPVERSLLKDGANTVTLAALNGDNDVSVVQSIALHYPHTYAADASWLKATAPAGDTVHFTGFSSPQIHVFDITDPLAITELSGAVTLEGANYGITLVLSGSAVQEHTLLAFSDDQVSAPSALAFHKPTSLSEQRQGGHIVIITHPDFESNLAPLVKVHESQGQAVELVTIDQVFDAFNFGERSPFAIRDFLQHASTHWSRKPQAVLLVGDASLDPRGYLGLGDSDFVPTRIIETAAFKTASDDWFSDFRQNGFATIPTGRIPVRTAADADLVVSKIVNYEKGIGAGTWNQEALVIADQNIDDDFTTAANFAAASLPSFLAVTEILANGLDPNTARQQIFTALNKGALLVNYEGHGSNEQWSFADLFDNSSAFALTNGNRLPVYLVMDCLNGFFHDVYSTSLAESLLLAPHGGAVAVWASSGFTTAPPQAAMDQALLHILKANPAISLGLAVLEAKSGVSDPDVRRTWIFFGDPAMHLQLPTSISDKHR